MEIEVVTFTGNNERRTAKGSASRLGIDMVITHLLPQQKRQAILILIKDVIGGSHNTRFGKKDNLLIYYCGVNCNARTQIRTVLRNSSL